MKLKIILWPNNILRKKTIKIKKINLKIVKIIKTMYIFLEKNKNAIGLAASQLGYNYNFFLIKIKNKIEIIINPNIIKKGKKKIYSKEACLSVIGKTNIVVRKKNIILLYINIINKKKKKFLENKDSICAQHEVDHLNGILWIDH